MFHPAWFKTGLVCYNDLDSCSLIFFSLMELMLSSLIPGGTPNLMSASLPGNKRVGNFTAPSSTQSVTRKRKSAEVSLGAPPPSVSSKG